MLSAVLFANVPYSYYDFEDSNNFEKFSPNGYTLLRGEHLGSIGVFRDLKAVSVTEADAYSGRYSVRVARRPKGTAQQPFTITNPKPIPVPAVVEFMVKRSEKTGFTASIWAPGRSKIEERAVFTVATSGKMGFYNTKGKGGYSYVTTVMPHNHWVKIRFNVGKEGTEIFYIAEIFS